MAQHFGNDVGAGAFGALGGGAAGGFIPTDGSDNQQERFQGGNNGGGQLFFESPPNNAMQDDYVNERYHRYGAPQLNNFITVRVFLRVLQTEESPSQATTDQQKALFKQLLEKTPVNDTSSALSRPVVYDGQDQVYIDIEMEQHLNCIDLMIRTVDWFNEHFREVQGPLVLDDQCIDYYQLYMAKKNGKPNDDFPSIERSQIVSKVNYTRFALCFDVGALRPNGQVVQQQLQNPMQKSSESVISALKDPKKQSMLQSTASIHNTQHQNQQQQQMADDYKSHQSSLIIGGAAGGNAKSSMSRKKPNTEQLETEHKSCCIIF